MIKAFVCAGMTIIETPVCFVGGLLLSPLLLVALVVGLWPRLELWAFYDGDDDARRRDELVYRPPFD